ncbi:MAG: hypothetical protein QMD77_03635 [Patescibacteria group bacterium]|nr:hypothetical protein [Patescibacteria group bacterium]
MIQFKKFKKIRLNPFQKVDFKLKSVEMAVLVLVCVGVFGAAFFAGGRVMGGHDKKITQMFRGEKVLAAEDQKDGNTADSEENISLEGKKASEAMSGAVGSVKRKLARPKKIAPKIISTLPPPRAKTKKVNGLRVCAKKNDHGHESRNRSQPHMDRECCPDPDEWPNPHCYYTPRQLSRMRKPPQ